MTLGQACCRALAPCPCAGARGGGSKGPASRQKHLGQFRYQSWWLGDCQLRRVEDRAQGVHEGAWMVPEPQKEHEEDAVRESLCLGPCTVLLWQRNLSFLSKQIWFKTGKTKLN